MLGQVVVEGLVNGFNGWLDGVADNIRYALGRFIDVFKVERLVVDVKQIMLAESPNRIKKQAAEIQSLILWVVEHSGLEPLTSTLPVLRSTR